MFGLFFYMEEDGSLPVAQFILELNPKLQAKVVSDLIRLKMIGNEMREPLSKYLGDGIFELRSIQGNNIVRILYFYDRDRIIVVTNGFVKKQQRTPRREIRLAAQRRKLYLETGRRGEWTI